MLSAHRTEQEEERPARHPARLSRVFCPNRQVAIHADTATDGGVTAQGSE